MGIQGLLPLVKSIEKQVHLKQYAGMTLAVDGYVWLHKGAFSCAQELCLGQPTQKYVIYFMRQIEMFKFFGVKPYVVFDGGYLPSKAATEDERLSRREESKKQAMELLKAGKSKQALEQFRKCVDVTPEMAHAVIQALKAANVDYVVAPYEADAQLAYLEKCGIVDGIVTEDSDLIVFGCKRMIFKLDKFGAGIEILHDNLRMVQEVSFHDWSMTEIRHMCILSGCDYLPSIPGMGLKTAQRLLRRLKTVDKVIRNIRMENITMKVQPDYEQSFRRADLTFLFARVYDPVTKSMVHLNPVPQELQEFVNTDEYDFLGPLLKQKVVQGVATGELNPITKAPLLSGPISRPLPKLNHAPLLKFPGKENKQAFRAPHTPQSTKAIGSYFTPSTRVVSIKPTKTTSRPSVTLPNREPLTDLEACKSNKLEEVVPDEDVPKTKSQPDVVVVSRSRFFGFEPVQEQDLEPTPAAKVTCGNKKSESYTHREDSGISLVDEIDDTDDLDAPHYSQEIFEVSSSTDIESSQKTLSSQEDSSQASTTSEAAERVIHGWREKFSHMSGSALTGKRPLGLTRAVQSACKVQRSTMATTTTTMTRNQDSKGADSEKEIVSRTFSMSTSTVIGVTSGYSNNKVDTPAQPRPLKANFASLANKRAAATIRAYPARAKPSTASSTYAASSSGTTLLNLDRFKYTPSHS
ncbi:Rad2 nuclease [Podila epigama]|nr:Rad2 nuclease [Podila epigama]